MMMLLPCTAFASGNCRLIEYPDHYEAICDGSTEQTSESTQKTVEEVAQVPVEIPDVPPEMIVRNGLASLHAAAWLKTRPGQ